MPAKLAEPKKEKDESGQQEKGDGFDTSALLRRKASLKYVLAAGAIGAAVLFLFYIAKLILDAVAVKSFSFITASIYPIALFVPILIGIGIAFGLKRIEPGATLADGAISGLVAGILGSILGAVAIFAELFLLNIAAPFTIFGGTIGGIAMLAVISIIQTVLCILAAAITSHFLKGGG